MNIAVYVRRLNQLRHVEATIREASARGHEVTLVLDDQGEVGVKASERARPERAPVRFAQWCRVAPWSSGLVSADLADALLVPAGLDLNWSRLPVTRFRAVVQTNVTDLLRLDQDRWSLVFGWSASWGEHWSSIASAPDVARIRRVFRPVGLPVADCQTLPIASGPMVVYLPFMGGSRLVRARYLLWDQPRLLTELRAYCGRYGAALIVKSRAKTPVDSALRRAADNVIDADEPGEPTLWRLLVNASVGGGLLVHHMSTGVAEAAAAGIQSLGIMPHGWDWPMDERIDVPDLMPHGGFYHWRGLSQVVRPDAARFLFSNDADLLARPLGDALAAYRSKFLGPRGAGLNIVKALEETVA